MRTTHRAKPELKTTNNYALFVSHDHNRPHHEDPVLEASMRKHGFLPSNPLQVEENGDGKLHVVKGHHRLYYAKLIGLPVWYVIENARVDLFELEATRAKWTVDDFATNRAARGDLEVQKVLDFMRRHGLNISTAASLVGGESAGSGNKARLIQSGSFRAAEDMTHATRVVRVTDLCRKLGLKYATRSAFVAAVSALTRLPEFDTDVLIHKLKNNPGFMKHQPTRDDWFVELERLYNYQSKRPVNLAFLAREEGKRRHVTFGRPSRASVRDTDELTVRGNGR